MNRKFLSIIALVTMLVYMPTTLNIRSVLASEVIYVRIDGSVDPSTAPIQRSGDTYVLTGNITSDADGIIIERDHTILRGNGHTLQGSGSGKGVNLAYRRNVTVSGLNIKQFDSGINLYKSSNNTISENSSTGNDEGVKIRSSSNNTIVNNKIIGSMSDGIILSSSNLDVVSGNSITTNDGGCITIVGSSYITVSENTLKSSHDGIHVLESSNNIIVENKIIGNRLEGIWLDSSSQNIITGNNVVSNAYAIKFYQSSNNSIYGNNFLNNTLQVYDVSWGCQACNPSFNMWNSSSSPGGSYWSDYTERYQNATESTNLGIWNTPYIIDEINQDYYPLMNPYGDVESPFADGGPDLTGILGRSVAFDGGKSTDDVAIRSYVWSFTGVVSQALTGVRPTYKFDSAGDFQVILNVSDYVGNWNVDVVAVRVRIVSIQSPENMTYPAVNVPLNLVVSESISWIGYSLDGQANVTVTGNTALSGLLSGSHNLIVYAKDNIGNTWISDAVYFSVETKDAEPFPVEIAVVFAIVGVVGTAVFIYLRKLKK